MILSKEKLPNGDEAFRIVRNGVAETIVVKAETARAYDRYVEEWKEALERLSWGTQ